MQHISLAPCHTQSKSLLQTVSMSLGILLFLFGFISMPFPTVFNLYFNFGHCIVISATGAILAWNGHLNKTRNCFYTCVFLGFFLISHAFAGMIIDETLGVNSENPWVGSFVLERVFDYFSLNQPEQAFLFIVGFFLLSISAENYLHYKRANFTKVTKHE